MDQHLVGAEDLDALDPIVTLLERNFGGGVRQVFERRLHIEEDELIGTAVGVRRTQINRITDVTQPLELDALHDTATSHVKTRN